MARLKNFVLAGTSDECVWGFRKKFIALGEAGGTFGAFLRAAPATDEHGRRRPTGMPGPAARKPLRGSVGLFGPVSATPMLIA
jgi:hypothetical protein